MSERYHKVCNTRAFTVMTIRTFLFWVLLEPSFIASAVVATMRMHFQDHVAHRTSRLYTSVRSLCDLHSFGPSAFGCVNSVETCTSVYNLHLHHSTIILLLRDVAVGGSVPVCVCY